MARMPLAAWVAFDQAFMASIWHIGDLGDAGVLECVKDRIPPGVSLGLGQSTG